MIEATIQPFIQQLALFICFNFGGVYGYVENRLFYEAGELLPGRHFKVYHAWLALLVAVTALIVYALSGSLMLALWSAIFFPLELDIVWWLKRWLDFHVKASMFGITVFMGYDAALQFYDSGKGNAWHMRDDWDNYGKLPLVMGTYAWWWIFSGVLAVLGVAILLL